MEKGVADAAELPMAIVRRVVKEKLSECSPDVDILVHKEALLALSESARIFIHYLSATANDICKESKRQTIIADDVSKALEEIEFPEFTEDFNASLADFRQKNSGKKATASKAKEVKKRKLEETTAKSKGKSKKVEEETEEKDDDADSN
ncbi:DNA polymerase epsilon subunit 3 [Tripterygium wilfordii]|uniref:DNA polymerase epsilon subunit 3 n=1 Tax=Tripterygium wilfordii TaxID=458696 RepID=A0A7J7DZL6_TRIWF|nr:DNA polymerase epsilon subunit 3 [Tripterygium wilfordii]KAF5751721.1 DNA polymerase epsilon subunit 3 [Tripterygium wilfordii]